MNATLRRALAIARRRRAVQLAIVAFPAVVAAAAVAWRLGGGAALAVVLAVSLAAAAVGVHRALRALDARWAVRRLDRDPARADSADLLLHDGGTLGPLQRLQRARIEATLADVAGELRLPWPRRTLAVAWPGAAVLVALALAWPPAATRAVPDTVAPRTATTPATHTTVVSASLSIAPPAYTGLAATTQADLSAKVPAGTTLRWAFEFAPAPRAAELRFHDGRVVALARDGGTWRGETVLQRGALYSLAVTDGLPPADTARHRLDAVPDAPPRLRVVAPERSLTMRTAGQRTFDLRVEATDDHGLGPARWVVTLAQGSGEQVTVSERTVAARGTGEATARRYETALDLGALGFAAGDDLIVRLEASDNRAPVPQRARSASVILRWPPPASTASTGMEGLVRRALPAYFRSQRQIIIDTEALVAERGALGAERFEAKSDAIGVDQRILRMRYGEFLGEENAGQPDAGGGPGDDGHDDHDGHADEAPGGFGAAIDVLGEYGHTHDDAEAATLLDPQTRALLKQALDAMWQSERELRTARPESALPHQYRALAFIKRVQQATRIYLARVGLELPAIDESRRMTGVRDGIADRRGGLRAADTDPPPALALWQALDGERADDATLAAFSGWLAANERAVDDALGLVAAVDAVRDDPACADCRATLRARLWPLLPRAVPSVEPRAAADAEGAAYLDALADEPPADPADGAMR